MPANVALEAAATGARTSAEDDAQQTVDAEQGSRKNRAKVAARALLMEFPEVALGVPPMPPYSNAIAKYAEEFGISVEEIEGELAGLEGEAERIQGPSLPVTGEGQLGGAEGVPTSAMGGPMGMPDIPNIPWGDIFGGIGQQSSYMSPTGPMISPSPEIVSGVGSKLKGIQLGTGTMGRPTVGYEEHVPPAVYPTALSGGPLTEMPEGFRKAGLPFDESDRFRSSRTYEPPTVTDEITTALTEAPDEPAVLPIPTAGEELYGTPLEGLPVEAPTELPTGLAAPTDGTDFDYRDQTLTPEMEMYAQMTGYGNVREDDPFKDFADPSAAAYESAARGWLGPDANREAYMQAVKKGQLHAKGSFVLHNLLSNIMQGATYHNYLTKGPHIDPKETQPIYNAISRASAAAHLSDNPMDWATKEDYKLLSDDQILLIGEMVRNQPDIEVALVAAQEGITGKGYLGGLQLQGLYNLKKYYDNRLIRDPDAEPIGFMPWWDQQKGKRFAQAPAVAQPAAALKPETPQKLPFEEFAPKQEATPGVYPTMESFVT